MLQLKKTTTINFRFSMSSKVCSKPKNVHLKWFLQYMYCAASDPPPLDIICFCKFSPLIVSLVFTAALFEYCIGERKKNKKTQSDMTALGFSCWLNKGCNQWLWSSLIRQQFQSEHTVLRAQDRIDHCLHTGLQPKTPKNQWDNKYKANKTRHLYLRSIQLMCRLIIVIVSVIAHIQTQLVSIKMRYFRKCSLL